MAVGFGFCWVDFFFLTFINILFKISIFIYYMTIEQLNIDQL